MLPAAKAGTCSKNSCGRKVVKALQVRPADFFAAAKDRAAVNQEAGDFPSIETFFRGRGKT